MKTYIKGEIQILEEKIAQLEKSLSLMPEDTVLGRWCVKSYIKKYQKELEQLKNSLHS